MGDYMNVGYILVRFELVNKASQIYRGVLRMLSIVTIQHD